MTQSHNIYEYFRTQILTLIEDLIQDNKLPKDLQTQSVTVQAPKDTSHGDLATNVAMVLAKQAGQNPKDLASLFKPYLEDFKAVDHVQIAGPGFINLTLQKEFWIEQIPPILRAGLNYGDSLLGQGAPINVEYVSTNPTGPLHIGHCRVAIVGDVLASLLEKSGFKVTREYYINDAGGQANDLARSAHKRYLEALGHKVDELGSYGGTYLIPVGEKLAKEVGDLYEKTPEEEWLAPIRAFAIAEMMNLIKHDLSALGIHQDIFSSELAIVKAGKVEQALKALADKGLIYKGVLEQPKGKQIDDWEPREQTLFKSSQFGDDTDRALIKSDGTWTYFASDIAYHYDKLLRGSNTLINVWGADHAGYVKRLTSAVKALSDNRATVICLLAQMVRFMVDGEPVKMSKRKGTFITVNDALEKVGLDAMRFMMMSRRCDQALDFDFKKVVEQSKDNPVFYVQYAYARAHSIKRHIKDLFPDLDLSPNALADLDLKSLKEDAFIDVIQKLAQWPQLVKSAAELHEPHKITFYLQELAASFHGLWNLGKDAHHLRFINPANAHETQINFALIQAVVTVLASGFKLLGIPPREEM